MHLKFNEVGPIRHPLVKELAFFSFHQLVTSLKFLINPTRHVHQSLRGESATVAKASIDGYGIIVLEVLQSVLYGGVVELGDIILNTAGCSAGILLTYSLIRLRRRRGL